MKIYLSWVLPILLGAVAVILALESGLLVRAADPLVSSGVAGTDAAPKPTIVLVHGAFADSSSWNGVVSRLQTEGYRTVAVDFPLRSLRSDSEQLAAIFRSISGPIVAVGHSYGGLVITEAAAGNPQVMALVYVAAFAPEVGESAAELTKLFPGSSLGPTLASRVAHSDGGKELYILQDRYHEQFAADIPEAAAKLMAVAQRPIAEEALHERVKAATWHAVPSWFIYGSQDKNIPGAAFVFMAGRARARETIKVEGASHVVMISHADSVAALITRAAMSVTAVAAKPVQALTPALSLPIEGRFPSLTGANGWLNSPPLNSSSLRGRVVLVQFWTYSCINWLRTLPYVRAWSQKYGDQGLVVIGVHTPEFGFEKELENIRRAAKEMAITYPIAIDSDRAVWHEFGNNYWPALYFVDAMGRIRYHHFGEGDYEQSERVIQQLLTEAGNQVISRELVPPNGQGIEAAASRSAFGSPETYVGYERTERFASPGGAVLGRRKVFSLPARIKLNQWALQGDWTMKKEEAVLNQANGRIAYRFYARDLHLVMGSAVRGTSVRFRILIDGHPPGVAHGIDVDELGNGMVSEPRLYQLIRQRDPIKERQFEIEFIDPGVEAFSFTFG